MQYNKNLQIEGLRGIGIIIILLFHFLYWRAGFPENERYTLPWLREWGLVGVGLFFIISGYFLFPPHEDKKISPFHYLIRKVKHLWIPYALSVTLIWILLFFCIYADFQSPPKDLILNITGLNIIFKTKYVDGAHWYLIQLITFILFASIIRWKQLDLRYVIPIYFILCIIVHLYDNTDNSIISLIFGMYKNNWNFVTLSMGICLRQFVYSQNKDKWIFLCYMIVCCFSLYFFYEPPYWYTSTAVISLLGFYFVFFLCVQGKVKFLEKKAFIFLGNISFYVYLMHQKLGYICIYYLLPNFGEIVSVSAACILAINLGLMLMKINNWVQKIINNLARE